MGQVHAEIELANPRRPDLKPIVVTSLVDTGAMHLCIPAHLALQLAVEAVDEREVVLADGRRALAAYVGPIQVTFEKRRCFAGAFVLGDEPLLGAIVMEDLDLVISLRDRTLTVNPASPNFAQSRV